MTAAGDTLRRARRDAGLTQAELARRVGTSQSAIAQLERSRSNPTVATLARALRATGHELRLSAPRAKPNVDLTLIARQLRMTPAERLASFESAYADAREISLAGARARGELA